jgi:hypothetical protein
LDGLPDNNNNEPRNSPGQKLENQFTLKEQKWEKIAA